MAKKKATTDRRMMVGTEGNQDYLVAARAKGFILGVKALYIQTMDMAGFGVRIRLEQDNKPDIISSADKNAMCEVFKAIPWSKRSKDRFSTVLTKEISYGIDFPEQTMKVIEAEVDSLLVEVENLFADNEKWLNRDDLVAYLLECYKTQQQTLLDAYEEYKAEKSGKPKSKAKLEGEAEVINFPEPTA